MRDFKRILAEKIKNGEHIALYCYGILASHLFCYLEKFYGVVPTVVIDNDERKKGTAEFGIPVMPFVEAREQFGDLQYFICSDDFKYTIIGDLLEKGVQPESIINYVPVEKRRTCLYFYNRLLLIQGLDNGAHSIAHCNKDSFKPQTAATRIPGQDGVYAETGKLLDQAFSAFERGTMASCQECVMNKEQYIISRDCRKHYKSIAFYQETCADCLSHCIYCCVGGNVKGETYVSLAPLEDYAKFVDSVFALDRIDDDFTCALDTSERDYDGKIALAMESLGKAGLTPLVYKVNSCLMVYSDHLAKLMQDGMVYVIWSLDAGTRETYQRIKQVDAFNNAIKNVRRYIEQDKFGGKFIVAKYLIVKGVNDNAEEFDAYLRIVTELGLQFVSLSFDFNIEADNRDLLFIQSCYKKITDTGLQLTYKNNSTAVTRALNMNNILDQSH